MRSNLREILYRVSVETFEELAFMVVARAAHVPSPLTWPNIGTVVSFDGGARGALAVAATDGVLREATNNMLGVTGMPPMALLVDSLGEIANVICGNLLGHIYDRRRLFTLHPPSMSNAIQGDLKAEVFLQMDGGLAGSRLYLDETVGFAG